MPSDFFKGMGKTLLGIYKERTPALYIPVSGNSYPLDLIFNAVHQEKDSAGIPIGAPQPVAWIKQELPTPAYTDRLRLNPGTPYEKEYIVREWELDGLELQKLVLTEA